MATVLGPGSVESGAHVARREAWAGLHRGDAVDVLDAREPRASWCFDALASNVATGEAWVEVVGGRSGERRRRAFRPEQVFPYRSVRNGVPTAPSLADAPALPL